MTQKYTPSEGEVRRAYASYMTLNGVHAGSVVIHHFLSEGKVIEFNSWLAAHDAQIRADNRHIFLKDAETITFAKAMFKELEEYGFFDYKAENKDDAYENAFVDEENGQYGFDAIEAGIKAVNRLRESTKEDEES